MKRVSAMRYLMIIAASVAFLGGQTARAGGPVAIVEDVSAPGAGVALMEYVESGRTINLGVRGTLILGYLRSCVRETITGGEVTVGVGSSTVKGARKYERVRVECDGGKLQISIEQRSKAAVMIFRKPPYCGSTEPAYKIFGTDPVIRVQAEVREITIERIDPPVKVMRFAVEGRLVDLADKGETLVPRGVYRVCSGRREIVVEVDANAVPGAGPLLGRLIGF